MFDKFKGFDYLTFKVDSQYLEFRIFCQGKFGILTRFLSYTFHFFNSFKLFAFDFKKCNVAFFYSTENQKKSLEQVRREYRRRHGMNDGFSFSLKNKISTDFSVPEVYSYLLSLPFLPILIIESLFSMILKKQYRRYAHGIDRYILSSGQFIMYYIYLLLIKPKIIVVSNDHNSEIRVLLDVARKHGIKLVYIQHATPNSNLPPLEQFDISLLDGEASLDIYHSIGPTSKIVKLVGISKLDAVKRKIDTYSKGEMISLALNASFNMDNVKKLIKYINGLGFCVHVRLHPGQIKRKAFFERELADYRVTYSDPMSDDLFSFILGSRLIIAGNSNIILEAALLNVPTFYTMLDETEFDYYGFVKSNITIDITNSFEKLSKFLIDNNSEKISHDKLKYFDNSVGEVYFGYTNVLVCDYIDKICECR
ncbi:hypothetical protein [Aliivibrio fischeri]|uniref:hypothetical protein n=1 Tax=Aliivibrio fischeri TaxID=668 RepID=UPI003734E426